MEFALFCNLAFFWKIHHFIFTDGSLFSLERHLKLQRKLGAGTTIKAVFTMSIFARGF